MRRYWCTLMIMLSLTACKQKKSTETLFELVEKSGINFTNTVSNTTDFNIFSYRNFYNGGGCAIGDINNDGLADVFFTANMGSNKLYINKGNWKFEDVSDKAGITESNKWSTGVVMVDINNDGWLDIYVCNAGYQRGMRQENALFINLKNGSFKESAREYGLANDGYTTHAAFFDYDLDGDLDCYILNNSFIPVNTLNYSNKRDLRAKDWPVADFLKGGGSYLLRNDNGKFIDVSEAAGIYGSLISFGLGVTVGDVNGDLYPDIYVSNDFFERDYLYINNRNGGFSEELESWMQHISHSSMGADMADINNDGYPDIFVTEMLPDDETRLKTTTAFEHYDVQRLKERSGFYNQFMQNTLQVNNQNGKFMETAFFSGVAASDWSWGGLIFDADNDGWNDLYVSNGIYNDVTDQDFIDFFANDIIQKMVLTGQKEDIEGIIGKMPSRAIPNKMYRNNGRLHFTDMAGEWGIAIPSFSNGAAYGDLDNDGDLDLIVNNVNQESFVFRNNSRQQNGNAYIAFSLEGDSLNRFAIGAKINLYNSDQIMSRELVPTRGFQSSVEYKVSFGLGITNPDSAVITWPDRKRTVIIRPEVNKLHVVKKNSNAIQGILLPEKSTPQLFVVDSTVFKTHQEDDQIDFYNERNIPVMLSREGPKAAVADLNGDGKEDIYICGAEGQTGSLYIQGDNRFRLVNIAGAEEFVSVEETVACFFDADSDGDNDLFIGAGGNHHPPNSKELQHRLYLNDGKANFTIAANRFSRNSVNISVAIPNDVDGDGDLDLFVGGRSVPYQYGIAADSYLYINDGNGNFIDRLADWNKTLVKGGMVTSAVWVDLDKEGNKELVIVGEWMSPGVYRIRNNKLEPVLTGLEHLLGWWQTVTTADLDNDGDQDLVMGNFGSNFYLKPDSVNPVKLWSSDFDKNGNVDKVFTRSIAGKDMPVFLKRELTDQIPSLKKQNLRHEQYATKSIQDLFNPEDIKEAVMKEFNYSLSIIAINDGKGGFSIKEMPYQVQLAPVNAIVCTDLNGDGKIDLLMGGNNTFLQPQFGRLDASYGHVLINDGNAGFSWLPPAKSGLQVTGVIRQILPLNQKGKSSYLLLRNNEKPVQLTLRTKSKI